MKGILFDLKIDDIQISNRSPKASIKYLMMVVILTADLILLPIL